MQNTPIRYENIAAEMVREIILGKYPVGTQLKNKEICKKYKIGVATCYKILDILVAKDLVEHIPRKGYVVIHFDEKQSKQQLHEEAIDGLIGAVQICKKVDLPRDKVATVIQKAYCKQSLPERG